MATTTSSASTRPSSRLGLTIRPHLLLLLHLLPLLLFFFFFPTPTVGLGVERRTFTTPAFDYSDNHRQDLCTRFQSYHNNETSLENALQGLQLSTLFFSDAYFPYDDETGIHPNDPGLLAELMDELAARAGFQWRQSFGVINRTDYEIQNKTFVDVLVWGVETHDIFVAWVAQSIERMRKGVAFVEPWYDSSTILIDKQDLQSSTNDINWFAWLGPFEGNVWAMTMITVLVSGVVFQMIENLDGEREGRPLRQWFSDNLYLSCLSLFQTFEYAPHSVSGRIFGVSMTIWSLIMTSTYTANLASMLVMENRPIDRVDTIEKAIEMDIPICTKRGVVIDEDVLPKYPGAKVIRTSSFLESYEALNSGECKIVLDQMDSWLNYRVNSQYNPSPDCNLEWVGKKVDNNGGGLALKADAGHLCTSFLRDVLDVHMKDLIDAGVIDKLWAKHRNQVDDGKCFGGETAAGAAASDDAGRRRQRRRLRFRHQPSSSSSRYDDESGSQQQQGHRRLKKSGGGGDTESSKSSSAMSLQEMAGTFMFHWVLMGFALCLSIAGNWIDKLGWFNKGKKILVRRVNRRHGPIVGMPPPINTWVEVDQKKEHNKAAGCAECSRHTDDDHDDPRTDDNDNNTDNDDSIHLDDLLLKDNSLTSYGVDYVGAANHNNRDDNKHKTEKTTCCEDSLTSYGHGSFQKPAVSSYRASVDGKRKTITTCNKRKKPFSNGSRSNLARRRSATEQRRHSQQESHHEDLVYRMDAMMSMMEQVLKREERCRAVKSVIYET